jgi:hypothetical protein
LSLVLNSPLFLNFKCISEEMIEKVEEIRGRKKEVFS